MERVYIPETIGTLKVHILSKCG